MTDKECVEFYQILFPNHRIVDDTGEEFVTKEEAVDYIRKCVFGVNPMTLSPTEKKWLKSKGLTTKLLNEPDDHKQKPVI